MEAEPNIQGPQKPVPKRSCMITLMFEIKGDAEALAVKSVIDKAVADIENKRYTFQLSEN